MGTEIVQKIDCLDKMLEESRHHSDCELHYPHSLIIQRIWNLLPVEHQRSLIMSKDILAMFKSKSDAQLLSSPCLPPLGYLLCSHRDNEVFTAEHIVWSECEGAWIKPFTAMIGKSTRPAVSAARPLHGEDGEPFSRWDENCSPEAMATRNAKIAHENGLDLLNPFIPHSDMFNAFQEGWDSAVPLTQEQKVVPPSPLDGLNDVQVAYVQGLPKRYQEEIAGYIRTNVEVVVYHQKETGADVLPFAIAVKSTYNTPDNFWIDCRPTEAEAIALAESLGLKVVPIK
ncbi:hypothetical protein ACYPKM_01470 [Pseudomonas aeruginosa]